MIKRKPIFHPLNAAILAMRRFVRQSLASPTSLSRANSGHAYPQISNASLTEELYTFIAQFELSVQIRCADCGFDNIRQHWIVWINWSIKWQGTMSLPFVESSPAIFFTLFFFVSFTESQSPQPIPSRG